MGSASCSPKEQAVIFSNRAMARLKVKDYASALEDADKALELDQRNVKALHRRGQALIGLKRPAEAVTTLRDGCAQLEEKEAGLEELLAQAEALLKQQPND